MVSTHAHPACLPFVCDELFSADRADGWGQKGAEMRGTVTGHVLWG